MSTLTPQTPTYQVKPDQGAAANLPLHRATLLWPETVPAATHGIKTDKEHSHPRHRSLSVLFLSPGGTKPMRTKNTWKTKDQNSFFDSSAYKKIEKASNYFIIFFVMYLLGHFYLAYQRGVFN